MLDMYLNKIICEDNVSFCKRLPNNSIDMILTSCPYDDLRDYNSYIFDFESLAHEMYRILKEGGVLIWVVNDATVKYSLTLTSMRQAIYFIDDVGFKMHDVMGYGKVNPLPSNMIRKKYASSYEYMFVLKKGNMPKTFNPIKTKNKWAGIKAGLAQRGKDGVMPKKTIIVNDTKIKENFWFYESEDYIFDPNLWYYDVGYNLTTTDKIAYEHPAIFPEALARDHIKTWTNPGDIVFDPFMGAGTTGKMALLLDRYYIGTDISEKYCEIARKRCDIYSRQYDMFSEIQKTNNNETNMEIFDDKG